MDKHARKDSTLFRAVMDLGADTEWQRLVNLASAQETVHHAIQTMLGLLDTDDFGAAFEEALRAIGDDLWTKARTVRARASLREREARMRAERETGA